MRYTLEEPIPYRTLSGRDIMYDCVCIETDKKNRLTIVMSRTAALPSRLEAVLTAPHIYCPKDLVALKQHAKCIEISNELIRRGILRHDTTYPTIQSRFVDYNFYRFNHEYFEVEAEMEAQTVS